MDISQLISPPQSITNDRKIQAYDTIMFLNIGSYLSTFTLSSL